MILDWTNLRLFVKPGPTDMRKQINGLSIIVQEQLQLDPFTGNLFLFCNRTKRLVKVIYWDRNGFCMWVKRLEKDKFSWPINSEEVREITLDQFKMLLDGIDFWRAHKKLKFSSVF